MGLVPPADKVLLTPYLPSKARADAVHRRSGLLIARPTNSGGSFEGIPNQGYVAALPEAYDGELQLNDHVAFSETAPKGFKNPEDPKQVLFCLQLDQIIGKIVEAK